MLSRLDEVCQEAESAIEQNYSFIVLSDRGVSDSRMSLSSLLSCSSVHHHLTKKTTQNENRYCGRNW